MLWPKPFVSMNWAFFQPWAIFFASLIETTSSSVSWTINPLIFSFEPNCLPENSFTLILNDKAESELNVKAKNTTLELSKDAELKALVASPELKIDMYEKSEAKIEGDSEIVKLRLDNSVNLDLMKLTAKDLEINIEGYAKAKVNVTNFITISAAGKSEIELYGEPKIEVSKFTNSTTLFKKEF